MEDAPNVMKEITQILERIRQAAADLQPHLLARLTACESRGLLKARRKGLEMVPTGIDLIERRPYLLGDGRTAADIREVEATMKALVLLMVPLDALAQQVGDSIRQYQIDLYSTVLNAYATACRLSSPPDVVEFAAEMRKQLRTGPQPRRMVKTRSVPSATIRVETDPAPQS